MTLPTLVRKRKRDSDLMGREKSQWRELNRTFPATDPLEQLVLNDEENFAFLTDPITSDPTFFDEYVPRQESESLRSSPPLRNWHEEDVPEGRDTIYKRHGNSLNTKDRNTSLSNAYHSLQQDEIPHPTAQIRAVSTEHSVGKSSPPRIEHHTFAPGNDAFREENVGRPILQVTKNVSPARLHAISCGRETHVGEARNPAPGRSDILASDNETDAGSDDKIEEESARVQTSSSQTSIDPPSDDLEQADPVMSVETPPHMKRKKALATTVPSSPRTTTYIAAAEPERAQKRASTNTKRVRKDQPGGRTINYDILSQNKSEDQAYTPRSRKSGVEWEILTRKRSFAQTITKHAKVRHTEGDIAKLHFPEGEGGPARIVEVRGEDDLFIVVQWLYSRTDAARSGGKLPPFEKWPKSTYMLSDHFQVIGIENVQGGSSIRPIDGMYWQLGTRSLHPSIELDRRLERQLQARPKD